MAARGSLRLAFVAALQHLPARRRAVLILWDVSASRAPEVASLLGTSTVPVKSSLQRARARLDEVAPDEDLVVELEMPPHLEWFSGKKDVLRFLGARVHEKGTLRMPPTRANGQPADAWMREVLS
ncbi:sigma factor-like helix-turn-helix DNA-binding protein [Streptomyces dysideae]|uniref:RNA polymerase sigma factor 70 region 4 type 2 domain-containing protein n=1 Tax=Streptomyces dysideae TaxID=909626 RepID=A0A117RYC4_9ACTN|nr:sigma factor-like helix-turn-helix DNA-binding protein [Streptomyces dysideae]KUO16311.1 hypothetical protein AQJ91_36250 [Streptomyces dysideae]